MKLDKKTVLVAGGAGFVGSQLVRELLNHGCRVVVYDNLLHGTKENLDGVRDRIELVVGDVLDEWKLSQAFRTHQPAYVFDLVGDTYVPTSYDIPKRFFAVNVEGTINVLMACKFFGVRRVLYVSSTEVYGEASPGPMGEAVALNPLNTYAVSKVAADRLCFTFQQEHGIPVLIARIFNSYGPRATEPYVIPEIITQLSKGNIIELGNLEAKRDFTYVSDTAQGLIAAMTSSIGNAEAVNIGSGAVHSVREVAHLIAQVMGRENVEIRVDPRRLRKRDIEVFHSDSSKLRQATGWAPTVPLEEGLKRTVAWFETHGKRWSWESWTEGPRVLDSRNHARE